ncbi:hypothetical protein ACFL6S_19205 [Candidatus Poribacteria bacterium]
MARSKSGKSRRRTLIRQQQRRRHRRVKARTAEVIQSSGTTT